MSWIGFGLFCVASLITGLRLLALWRREHVPGALLCAVGLLGMGPFGFVPSMLSPIVAGVSYPLGVVMWAVGFASLNLGATAVVFFTANVFRPSSAAVVRAAWFVVAAVTACWLAELTMNQFAPDRPAGPAARLSDWIRVGALGWAGVESMIYWQRMRRRVSLGLADVVVANRFWLWGIGAGAAALSCGIDATVKLVDARAYEWAWLNLANSLGGIVAAVSFILAFLPPARYVAYLRASIAR